jgi:hypothetical protein
VKGKNVKVKRTGTNQLLALMLVLILAIRELWPALLQLANEIMAIGQAMALIMFYCTFSAVLVTAVLVVLVGSAGGPHNY